MLRNRDEEQERVIIYGASQNDTRGKGVSLVTNAEFNDQTCKVEHTRTLKPFRTEPPDYNAANFVKKRNSRVKVVGGYRTADVLDYMKTVDLPQ